jgi:cytolysin (calcineurin-like family phosphatase)
MSRRLAMLAVLVLALGAAAWVFAPQRLTSLAQAPFDSFGVETPDQTPARPRTRQGGMDLTFVVTADTHFGYGDIAADHRRAIAAMNAIEGTDLPHEIGGRVGRPRGVLIAGDLTEDGRPEEWAQFLAHYEDSLDFPIYESWGNHDKHFGWYVREQVIERHGGLRYSFDWGDLHLVCLGEAPDLDDIAWLERDLASVGTEVGVVLYFHFPLQGPYSKHHWFGDGDYKRPLMSALTGYNVLAIFHGHYHASGRYSYQGHDVYNVGTPKHGHDSFAVVHVTDERMTVSSYNYSQKRWWWWHDKPIHHSQGPVRQSRSSAGFR